VKALKSAGYGARGGVDLVVGLGRNVKNYFG
jgi:hypothetical protein